MDLILKIYVVQTGIKGQTGTAEARAGGQGPRLRGRQVSLGTGQPHNYRRTQKDVDGVSGWRKEEEERCSQRSLLQDGAVKKERGMNAVKKLQEHAYLESRNRDLSLTFYRLLITATTHMKCFKMRRFHLLPTQKSTTPACPWHVRST